MAANVEEENDMASEFHFEYGHFCAISEVFEKSVFINTFIIICYDKSQINPNDNGILIKQLKILGVPPELADNATRLEFLPAVELVSFCVVRDMELDVRKVIQLKYGFEEFTILYELSD